MPACWRHWALTIPSDVCKRSCKTLWLYKCCINKDITVNITRLLIDQDVADLPVTRAVRACLDAPAQVIADPAEAYEWVRRSPHPVSAGKTLLWLTRNKGTFVRPCPGTSYYTCCNYTILHVGTFCTMDCSYCILQSYFHPPLLRYFVNHEDLHRALSETFASGRLLRVGTGEFTDSLIWERVYPRAARDLMERFATQDRAVLELKTKTVNVDHLLDVDHRRKTIFAWSLNTEHIVSTNERATAGLEERLKAAARCVAAGFPVAFHFDPMVIYPGCEEDYEEVIARLFAAVAPEHIVWISIGAFRFMPELKALIQERFPRSTIIYGEFIKGMDGKMRYFKPLRIRFYRRIIRRLRSLAPDVTAYFCMEDDEVWQKTFGFTPGEKGGLPGMLDKSAVKHCGLKALPGETPQRLP